MALVLGRSPNKHPASVSSVSYLLRILPTYREKLSTISIIINHFSLIRIDTTIDGDIVELAVGSFGDDLKAEALGLAKTSDVTIERRRINHSDDMSRFERVPPRATKYVGIELGWAECFPVGC